jgi:putative ABC transport system permease protein
MRCPSASPTARARACRTCRRATRARNSSRVLDRDRQPVQMPSRGLVLPELLARELDAREGDLLAVEFFTGNRETHILPVASVVPSRRWARRPICATMRCMRCCARSRGSTSSTSWSTRPNCRRSMRRSSRRRRSAAWRCGARCRQFDEQLDENLFTMVIIYATLGVLITVGVVYNAARIQLAERAYELASLRVLGFSRGEVSYVLVGEIMLLTVIGLPVGWLAGYGFAALSARGPVVGTRQHSARRFEEHLWLGDRAGLRVRARFRARRAPPARQGRSGQRIEAEGLDRCRRSASP